ncbi:MAG TPA: carbonic anhydrase [Methanospirillum sp.]|uniref:carbonic anhydrase n=1 Tax=Methanospirillum sp. TaxID=45200 RepID=UPI002D17A67F|nr:carbonic anhydrase [Methanospirillum sp.]HWQ62868.1 carbonic anhydrase [Methanospirillum sp.]
MGIEKLLEGNNHFVEYEFSENIEYYKELLKGQSPHVMMISCCDSRVAPEITCHAKPGEIFVHRNIGNIVPPGDWNVGTFLEYGIGHLHVDTLVVCGHEGCGAMHALAHRHCGDDAFIPGWLRHAQPALATVTEKNPYPDDPEKAKEWQSNLEIENVRLQLKHLRTYKIVRDSEREGKLRVIGLYYRISDAKLEVVDPGKPLKHDGKSS